MKQWIDAVRTELGISVDVGIDTDAILDVARDAAHTIERPAAPVTTYLLGYAAAQGINVQEAAEKIARLASTWPAKE
ncbi:MAG: DUF6457 domain-containing protein [Actinomycetota bacterium]